jgi:8-oxo-dGTP pyrophosphatase MutT (NUDIX family)
MGVVKQAGAVAVRRHGAGAEVLVVRAKKNPAHWIFPKGHIEPGETAAQAAVRELREEAGVVGEIAGPLGTSGFQLGGNDIEVSYFLVRCYGTAPPAERRETQWVRFDDARTILTFEDARRHLDAAEQIIAKQPL